MGRSVVMATEPLYGVTVKDVDQTLDYILAHHSSVARFGDGEIDLIAGRDIPYQSYDPALAEHLKRVLYTPSRPELGVCMSDVLDRKSTRLNSSHVSNSYAVFCLK